MDDISLYILLFLRLRCTRALCECGGFDRLREAARHARAFRVVFGVEKPDVPFFALEMISVVNGWRIAVWALPPSFFQLRHVHRHPVSGAPDLWTQVRIPPGSRRGCAVLHDRTRVRSGVGPVDASQLGARHHNWLTAMSEATQRRVPRPQEQLTVGVLQFC